MLATMAPSRSLLPVYYFTTFFLAVFSPAVLASTCDCYATNSTSNGGSKATYTNYTFIDFRSLSGDGALSSAPPAVNDTQTNGSGNITSTYFNSSTFSSVFALQNWVKLPAGGNVSSVELVNSPQNVYICKETPFVFQLPLNKSLLSILFPS